MQSSDRKNNNTRFPLTPADDPILIVIIEEFITVLRKVYLTLHHLIVKTSADALNAEQGIDSKGLMNQSDDVTNFQIKVIIIECDFA
ncbi:hypothetical protein D3C85_1324250 [compost metagenome]